MDDRQTDSEQFLYSNIRPPLPLFENVEDESRLFPIPNLQSTTHNFNFSDLDEALTQDSNPRLTSSGARGINNRNAVSVTTPKIVGTPFSPQPRVENRNHKRRISCLINPARHSSHVTRRKCGCEVSNSMLDDLEEAVDTYGNDILLVYKEVCLKNYTSIPRSGEFVYRKKFVKNFRKEIAKLQNPTLKSYLHHEKARSYLCEEHMQTASYTHEMENSMLEKHNICFDSEFESGNLSTAVKIRENEFDLFITPDTNTKGHHQWFYFAVRNNRATTIKLNIVNFTKSTSLHEKGMKICLFSRKFFEESGIEWYRGCENVTYTRNNIPRNSTSKLSYYYTLSFTYSFEYDQDTVFFAYSEPYTYSRCISFINNLQASLPSNSSFKLDIGEVTRTLGGLKCPLVQIYSKGNIKRGNIGITARVHPGETVSSFKLEGLLQFLVSDSPEARILRNNFTFTVIPMLNPDGVVCGNYRSCLSGQDLNRVWNNPEEIFYPVIYEAKNMLRNSLAVIDLHGHSKKLGSFIYGNKHYKTDEKYHRVRILPKLMAILCPYFSYRSTRFRGPVEGEHENTARAVLGREMGIVHSFTLETSFFGYDEKFYPVEFNAQKLREIGANLAQALLGLVSSEKIPRYTSDIISNLISKTKLDIEKYQRKKTARPSNRSDLPYKSESTRNSYKASTVSITFQNGISFRTPQPKEEPEHVSEDEKSISSGSDSDPFEDNLEPEEVLRIQNHIRKHIKKVDKILKPDSVQYEKKSTITNDQPLEHVFKKYARRRINFMSRVTRGLFEEMERSNFVKSSHINNPRYKLVFRNLWDKPQTPKLNEAFQSKNATLKRSIILPPVN
jgi:hypothetical protein